MTNKTVIRKENLSGQFTTIHNSILLDKRLTPIAFRLLTMILSDSDTKFNLSQTLYVNRLGITKQTFFDALVNLEECGYLRKVDINRDKATKKIVYHYTISEFGNLNPKEKELELSLLENVVVEESAEVKEILLPEQEIATDVNEYLLSIVNLLENAEVADFILNMIEKESTLGEIKKWVKKYLIDKYNQELNSISDKKEHPKAFNDFKSWLKSEIFEKYNLGVNASNKWFRLKNIKYAKPYETDYETKMGDYYESAKD